MTVIASSIPHVANQNLDYDSTTSTWDVAAYYPVEYRVRVDRNLFAPDNRSLLRACGNEDRTRRRQLVVLDRTVDVLHGDLIKTWFDAHDVAVTFHVMDAGELRKTIPAVQEVSARMDEFGLDRRGEPVLVIGGGVLSDTVGLAAGLYRRGTPFVRVPTTLIGQVDAGVGVKTGVNANGHKNRLGTYTPARTTLIDPAFLSTLDRRHVVNGLAEILKMALIKDRALFGLLERHGTDLVDGRFQPGPSITEPVVDEVFGRAIHGMLEELAPNLWEHDLERIVDYGHTFSPTIEMDALPDLLHGEAVAVDMALTTVLAEHRGLVTAAQRERILGLMHDLGLPVWHPACDPDRLVRALADTVRHRGGRQRLPIPVGIGAAVFVNDVTPDELTGAVARLRPADTGANRPAGALR